MTAIAPNTVIRMGQIYLQSGSEDTFYFDSVADQTTFMTTNLTHVFTKFTYQREHRNYVKIEITSEQDADKWDYMMFQNTSYGNKWFYAFITETEWINNLTVKVYYEIDYIQTYWHETSLYPCFVERMHNATDDIGDNIVPDITCGNDLYHNGFSRITDVQTQECYFVLAYLPNRGASWGPYAHSIGGIPSGCNIRYFLSSDTSGLISFMDTLNDKEQILALYTAPKGAFITVPSAGGTEYTDSYNGLFNNFQLSGTSTTDLLNGYRPKNNKMFTYPYNFLRVYNDSGDYIDLRYEYFTTVPTFSVDYSAMMPVSVTLGPTSYGGVSGSEPGPTLPPPPSITDKTKRLKITNYPLGSWTNDSYQQWVAFQGVPQAVKSIGSFALNPFNFINPARGVATAAGSYVNLATDAIVAHNKANDFNGNTQSGNSDFSSKRKNFYYARMSYVYSDAEIVDNYFTMFGYAQHKIMTPSRKVRSRFTYIKTVDAIVYGELPNNAKNAITALYNKGIRFWADRTNFRNYSLDNLTL